MDDNKLVISDVHQAAFIELNGIEPTLEKQGTRVVFTFQGSDAFHFANLFNENATVPVADFVETLKTLRGRMFTARGGR